MMLTDNENKQAKVLDDLASFYVSNTNIDFTPPDSPHKVTPPSSDSEQDPPSTVDPSQLEAFSNLFVNTSQDAKSRRRKTQHPQNRKQSVVAIAMATSVDKDTRRGRRGPNSTTQLDCDEYVEMEVPLKGGDDEDDDDDVDDDGESYQEPHQQQHLVQLEERGLSALEKLKRRSQSVDVRRVQRSRSDDLSEMDHGRRSSSQDARRRARRRGAEGVDGLSASLHTVARTATEGISALEKLKARSSSVDRKRVAPGRSQSDDLLERELRQFCSSNQDGRRRHSHGHSDADDDMSRGTQSTSTVPKGGEDVVENPPTSSRTIDRGLMPPIRRKSSDLIDMDPSRRSQSQRKHRSSFDAENETSAAVQPLKSDERSNGSSEKPPSRASSRERRRGVPERSKSEDFVDLDPSRRSNSHDMRRRARRPTKGDGDDSSVVSTEIRPSSMQAILVRKNSGEGEGSHQGAGAGAGATVQVLNSDDHSNTSSEKPKSSRSSSRERRRTLPDNSRTENAPESDRNGTLSSHFGRRRGRRPNGEDASLVESIAETPKMKNSSLDGRGSRHSTRGSRPPQRSKSVDVAFEMDVSRRSATSDEQRRRRQRASSKSPENLGDYDEPEEVVKPASDSSLGLDVRKKPQSARDASRIMAMQGDEVENERKEILRQERRSRSHSKWSELRQEMAAIDKARTHLGEERKNGRQTQRDRRGTGHSDNSSVVSSNAKDERSSRSNPRAERDRSSRGKPGNSDGPSRPTSERRMKSSENFDAQGPQGNGTNLSSSATSTAGDQTSGGTKSDQISSSTDNSDKAESQDEKEKVEPKKPQSTTFRNLLGASLGKKSASTTSSSDENGGGVPQEPISDESMHKGRTKGMNVLKKLLAAPSATSSDKAESADAAKKGTKWGGLRSGVDFTSRLIRSAVDSKKTTVDSENVEGTTEEGTTISSNETNTNGSPQQESTKEEASSQHENDGSRAERHEPQEILVEESSNHLRATDSQSSRLAEGQAKNYGKNEKRDPVPPPHADSTSIIAPELYEILNGPRAPDSIEQQRNGDRRGMMTGLAAPSLRFDVNHVESVVPRFQPDTILEEEEEEEDKSNSRHLPIQVLDSGDEPSMMEENQGINDGDLDDEEPDDEPESFLSPMKCVQLKFKPTFSPAGDLLVAIHSLDHEQESEASDDDESVKVHGMKMDTFELFDDTSPAVTGESYMDKTGDANDINDARQQELAAEYEYLQRQLCESRVRIQTSNEALRILQREMQQQTKLFEETKKRGRALKRVLREQNVLLLFN